MEDGRRQGDIRHGSWLITLLHGDAVAPLTGFLLLRLSLIAKEDPKMGVVDSLWWSSPEQGLSIASEGFCCPFQQGQVRHEVWVRVRFLSVDFTYLVC